MHVTGASYAIRDADGYPVVFYDVDPEGNPVIGGWTDYYEGPDDPEAEAWREWAEDARRLADEREKRRLRLLAAEEEHRRAVEAERRRRDEAIGRALSERARLGAWQPVGGPRVAMNEYDVMRANAIGTARMFRLGPVEVVVWREDVSGNRWRLYGEALRDGAGVTNTGLLDKSLPLGKRVVSLRRFVRAMLRDLPARA